MQAEQNYSTTEYINHLLNSAVTQHASDIHIEAGETQTRIRLRIDGLLKTFSLLPMQRYPALISRLKILAALDITERRLPQDGRFQFHIDAKKIDCRISTCPSLFGEKIVVRILKQKAQQRSLAELGLTTSQQPVLIRAMQKKQGLNLVTGPTGSGKTVTLYALLALLDREQYNICTAENPVEIQLPDITQVNIQHELNFDFAMALRTFLRQDPDVILIGEIRDRETANMAIRAAQTGHLVLASLHTSDAVSAIDRLHNLGVSRTDIAQLCNLILAQRLVRKKTADGYSGRTGVYSLLEITNDVQQAISAGAAISKIINIARRNNFSTLYEAGMEKVATGVTTQVEIKRVIDPDEIATSLHDS